MPPCRADGRARRRLEALVPNTLVSTHIDSWEVGSQNWTARLPRRVSTAARLRSVAAVAGGDRPRGGQPGVLRAVPLGPAANHFRLLVENYAGRFRRLAHRTACGCRSRPTTTAPATRWPMPARPTSRWPSSGPGRSSTRPTVARRLSSAAHVYGKRILGAEAFTATLREKWQSHPASSNLGDWALCEGVNRFLFHRYAMQPWPDRRPGMSMGPWGLHYERTQTWWEQSKAWHQYLALPVPLRQGLFRGGCLLTWSRRARRHNSSPSRWPQTGTRRDRPKYNFDGCTPEVVLTRMAVKDGRLVLPDGMNYRLLVLPRVDTMTPRLLTKIKELVEAGATVVAPAAEVAEPGDYPRVPRAHHKPRRSSVGQLRRQGRYRTSPGQRPGHSGPDAEEVLVGMGMRPDFDYRANGGRHVLRYTHRAGDGVDVYFVANKVGSPEEAVCQFRVQGKRPELWWPETGRIERTAAYDLAGDCVRVPLQLDSFGSVFVLFRSAAKPDRVTSITCNGRPVTTTAWKSDPGSTRANARRHGWNVLRNSLGQAGDGHHIAR